MWCFSCSFSTFLCLNLTNGRSKVSKFCTFTCICTCNPKLNHCIQFWGPPFKKDIGACPVKGKNAERERFRRLLMRGDWGSWGWLALRRRGSGGTLTLSTSAWKEGADRWGLISSTIPAIRGPEKTALNWDGEVQMKYYRKKKKILLGWSDMRKGCLRWWWSHPPCRCLDLGLGDMV